MLKPFILLPHRLPAHNEQQIRRILHTIEKMLKQADDANKTSKEQMDL